MNDSTHRMFGRAVWFVTGLASIGIGLHAAGLNVFAILHLCPFVSLVQYGIGLFGVASILMFFIKCCSNCHVR